MTSKFKIVHWELNPIKSLKGTRAAASQHFHFGLLRDIITESIIGIRLTWRLRITSEKEELILSYIGEDDIIFDRIPTLKHLEIISDASYARFQAEYGLKVLGTGFYYKLKPLPEDEINLTEILDHILRG